MHKRKLLAVGCPRSGSRFLVNALRNAGVQVKHEGMRPDGNVGMFFAVEDCWYPGKHWTVDEDHPVEDESRTRRSDYEFEQVWHYTRDPLKAIASIASTVFAPSVWCWQERHTGISCGLFPKKLRALRFWIAWNDLIESNEKIDMHFRIEDIDGRWDEIRHRLGIPADKVISKEIPRDYGSVEAPKQRPVSTTWDELKSLDAGYADAAKYMAERYGYEV